MVPIVSLWLAILLSAMIVFIVTSVIHMFLTYHRSDFGKVPSEDAVMDALRSFDIPPGDYVIPRAESTPGDEQFRVRRQVYEGLGRILDRNTERTDSYDQSPEPAVSILSSSRDRLRLRGRESSRSQCGLPWNLFRFAGTAPFLSTCSSPFPYLTNTTTMVGSAARILVAGTMVSCLYEDYL